MFALRSSELILRWCSIWDRINWTKTNGRGGLVNESRLDAHLAGSPDNDAKVMKHKSHKSTKNKQ